MFGSTLSENVRRYGNPLPPTILRAMQHLHDNGKEPHSNILVLAIATFTRSSGGLSKSACLLHEVKKPEMPDVGLVSGDECVASNFH